MVSIHSEEYKKGRAEEIREGDAARERARKRCDLAGKHVGKPVQASYVHSSNGYEVECVCACGWPYSRPMTEKEKQEFTETQRIKKASGLDGSDMLAEV